MQPQSDNATKRVVFWLFHGTNFALVGASVLATWYLRGENIFELVMAQLFIYGTLFTQIGAKAGGYLGAMMEEDACSIMDMGVLSSMGSFVGATISGLIGTAIVGLYFFLPPAWMSWGLIASYVLLFVFSIQNRAKVRRLTRINCCGNRVDVEGNVLPSQPMRMKNKVAILLAGTLVIEAFLTVLMFFLMKRDFANNTMLGGMMYPMGGSMLGGMLGGWLAGLLDEHEGEPEHDNPIMVCAMALMAGMMGGMPAAMTGGMMALMGAFTVVPTIAAATVLFAVCYFWIYKAEFKLEWTPRRESVPWMGVFQWQRQ